MSTDALPLLIFGQNARSKQTILTLTSTIIKVRCSFVDSDVGAGVGGGVGGAEAVEVQTDVSLV